MPRRRAGCVSRAAVVLAIGAWPFAFRKRDDGQMALRTTRGAEQLSLQLSLSEVLKPTVTAPPLRDRLTRQRNALIHVWEKTRETGRYRLPLERNKPRPGQDMLDPASHNRRLEELWHLLNHRRSSVRVKAAQSFCLTPQ